MPTPSTRPARLFRGGTNPLEARPTPGGGSGPATGAAPMEGRPPAEARAAAAGSLGEGGAEGGANLGNQLGGGGLSARHIQLRIGGAGVADAAADARCSRVRPRVLSAARAGRWLWWFWKTDSPCEKRME